MNKGKSTMKDPLTDKEQEQIILAARELGNYEGVSVERVVIVLLDTGMHVSVLANPEKHNVQFSINNQGSPIITWSRPKKKGSAAITRMKLTRRIREWIEEFMVSKRPNYTMFYWRMIRDLGKTAGMPNLSPMTFRHTFGVNLSRKGVPETQIKQLMNCSSETLGRYLKYNEEMLDDVLREDMGY